MVMQVADNQQDDTARAELVQILKRELGHVQHLMHALEEEYAALADQHTATLEDVVRAKQEIIRELEHIGRQRESLLASMNTTIEEQLTLVTHNPRIAAPNDQLSDVWNELVLLAEKCQEMNRINGSIVELVSRQSRYALDILHGISPNVSGQTELYDQTGYKTMSAETHSLTKA